MASIGKITRRTFLIGAAAAAGGIAVGYYLYRQPYDNPLEDEIAAGEATFNPYVMIAADNTITIIAPRAEMGQGVSTSLAAFVAEELDVRLEDITVEHGPASHAYHNTAMLEESAPYPAFDRGFMASSVRDVMGIVGKFLAVQATGGSSATIDGFEKMRHAGATAREMLKQAAADRFGVSAASLKTENRTVTDPASGQSATYGELAADAAKLDPPSNIALRGKSEWKILGKSQPRVDMRDKVTGAPLFGIDVELPDMLHATIRMSPRLGADMVSMDASDAEKMPGVVKVVRMDSPLGKGFAVIADNTWRAFKAADAVEVEWGEAPYPASSPEIYDKLTEAFNTVEPFSLRTLGNPDTEFADAPRDRMVEAEYRVPFLAHATMEPMNATAWLRDGKLDIWAPNQMPTIARMIGGRVSGLEEADIAVHTTHLGGGFGRRGEIDFVYYASMVAKETDGRPVKVTWTREEDMTHDLYRPSAIGRYKALLADNGTPTALHGTIAAPSLMKSFLGRVYPNISPMGPDKSIIEGAFDQPYAIENYRIDGKPADIGVPVSFWRSVGNSFNSFMHESFIDEIAAAGGQDPLDLRLKLMEPYPTATGVLRKVADMSGWGTALPEGKARGLAFCLCFGTWVAQVVQIAQEDGGIRIEKVWCAADCGTVIDPSIFEAQMMSGIVYGLSSALDEEITFADGMVEQSNFHDFDAMRIHQCPEIEVAILENSGHMGGAGEPGTPPSIPALANAVFALTGKRVRQMPLTKEVEFV